PRCTSELLSQIKQSIRFANYVCAEKQAQKAVRRLSVSNLGTARPTRELQLSIESVRWQIPGPTVIQRSEGAAPSPSRPGGSRSNPREVVEA
ncbi:AAEL009318-PA, partial [Aedes aegypti]